MRVDMFQRCELLFVRAHHYSYYTRDGSLTQCLQDLYEFRKNNYVTADFCCVSINMLSGEEHDGAGHGSR